MKAIVLIYLLIIFLAAFKTDAQSPVNREKISPAPEVQMVQPDAGANEMFTKWYKKRSFKRLKPVTMIDDSTFKYGSMKVKLYASSDIKSLFQKGVLYPEILHQYRFKIKRIRMVKSDLKTDTATLSNLIDFNEVSYRDFAELRSLESTPTQRRFRFLMWRKGFSNPNEYYFELINKRATKNTSLAEFIKVAKLTFVEDGGIWI